MDPVPAIAVVDDAEELEDVRALLDELGMEYALWGKECAPPVCREPRQLLVTTASAAVSLRYQRSRSEGDAVWIAVTHNDSRTQKSLLLQAGFDFLIRRPVHPSALRLLIQRSLFRGDDTRRGRRMAVGYAITFRSGLWPRKGTLVDLSMGGCRLLTAQSVNKGEKLTLQLPGEIDSGKTLVMTGEVLRVRKGEIEGGDPSEFSLAVRFAKATRKNRLRLKSMLEMLSSGPATLPADGESFAPRAARGSYSEHVFVFGSSDCALVGRDLSAGGMKVDPHPALHVGDHVRLALTAGPREEPLVVEARVVRDDGDLGVGIKFESVQEPARLEQLVSALPAIEGLNETSGSGRVVVSRIVPKLQRIARQSKGWTDKIRKS